MMKPYNKPKSYREIGKTIARKSTLLLTPILIHGLPAKFTQLLERYLALIQGKGSGTAWNIQAEITAAVLNIKHTDAIIFDVGANKGQWSLNLLKAVGANNFKIFLFDPSPHCQKILHSLNIPQKTLIKAAVGSKSGNAILYSPSPGSVMSSLHPRRESYCKHKNFQEEKVEVVTIDEIINKFKIDTVDFMKLDAEGHELDIIRGADNSLKNKRIKALTFEFGSGNINSRTYFHDFWDILHPYGYKVYRICPKGILIPIEKYYEDLEYFRGVSNYLAIS